MNKFSKKIIIRLILYTLIYFIVSFGIYKDHETREWWKNLIVYSIGVITIVSNQWRIFKKREEEI